MSKFFSTKYSTGSFNFGMLVLRVFLGLLLIGNHGYPKLVQFGSLRYKFMNFMNIGSTASLSLIIFAEVICGLLLILGLFTRFACIPVIIGMSVVVFVAAHGDIFGHGETGMMFLAAAITVLFCGPGRISIDGMIGK